MSEVPLYVARVAMISYNWTIMQGYIAHKKPPSRRTLQ